MMPSPTHATRFAILSERSRCGIDFLLTPRLPPGRCPLPRQQCGRRAHVTCDHHHMKTQLNASANRFANGFFLDRIPAIRDDAHTLLPPNSYQYGQCGPRPLQVSSDHRPAPCRPLTPYLRKQLCPVPISTERHQFTDTPSGPVKTEFRYYSGFTPRSGSTLDNSAVGWDSEAFSTGRWPSANFADSETHRPQTTTFS